jgi:hypothetical protein
MLVFSYGIKLFNYSIGIDTERYMAYDRSLTEDIKYINNKYIYEDVDWRPQGRFGLYFLQKIWDIKEFNPFTAFFLTLFFFYLSALSWSYLIAFYTNKLQHNYLLIPFSVFYITMPIWADQFGALLQSAETAFIIFLCPWSVFLLINGFFSRKLYLIFSGVFVLFFVISVYQAVVPLFCGGIFSCYLLVSENQEYPQEKNYLLCIYLFITLIASLALYFILNRLLILYYFNTEPSDYFNSIIRWGKEGSLKRNFTRIFSYIFSLSLGNFPYPVSRYIIQKFSRSGENAVESIINYSRITGNVLFIPLTILFFCVIFASLKEIKTAVNKWLYFISGFFVFFSIFLFPIIIGGTVFNRMQWVLPFTSAFMFYKLLVFFKDKKALHNIIFLSVILLSVHQAKITAQLFYSDYVRYQSDKEIAYKIDDMINEKYSAAGNLSLALIGGHERIFHKNFIKGELLGHSSFNYITENFFESSRHGLPFMYSLGIYYEMPNKEQMDMARGLARAMPSYPDRNCIGKINNVIVFKFSDSIYKGDKNDN